MYGVSVTRKAIHQNVLTKTLVTHRLLLCIFVVPIARGCVFYQVFCISACILGACILPLCKAYEGLN